MRRLSCFKRDVIMKKRDEEEHYTTAEHACDSYGDGWDVDGASAPSAGDRVGRATVATPGRHRRTTAASNSALTRSDLIADAPPNGHVHGGRGHKLIALLLSPRRRCCSWVRSPRNRWRTCVDHPRRRSVDPANSDTSVSVPYPPPTLS